MNEKSNVKVENKQSILWTGGKYHCALTMFDEDKALMLTTYLAFVFYFQTTDRKLLLCAIFP